METPPKAYTSSDKVGGGFGFILIFLIFAGALSAFWSTKRTLDTLYLVDQTHEVRFELERLLLALVDAETAAREYISTGDETFLDLFEPSLESSQKSLDNLRRLTQDHALQRKRLNRLAHAMQQKAAVLLDQIDTPRPGGAEVAASVMGTGDGKRLMDEIRSLVRAMENDEEWQLHERSEAARDALRTTLTLLIAGSAVVIAMVMLAAWSVRRHFAARREAAHLLERAKGYAESIVNTVREPLMVLDDALRVRTANRSFYHIFRTAAGVTEGRLLAELVEGAWADPKLQDLLKETLASDQRFDNFEMEHEFPHLGRRTMLLNGRKLFQPDDESNALLLGIDDITERKQADEELQKSTQEVYDLYNQAPCGYQSLDKDGMIIRINNTELNWLGYTREELVGKVRLFELMTPASRAAFFEHFARFKKEGSAHGVEFEMVRKDGSCMVVLLNSTALRDEEGYFLTSRATIFDITDRKADEQRVRMLNSELERRAALLEAANKELEAFSYSVSHDLRAPLRHIDGFAEMLSKQTNGMLDPKAQRYLKTIAESARRMGILIDDLLVFSRMGRTEMRRSQVDMNALVQETIHDLQSETAGRAIEWHCDPLPPVEGDSALLRQVFANLISNAVKYSRPRNPAVIHIGFKKEAKGGVIVFVRDNGVGFDMTYVGKLFGVFQRLHRANEFEGTGIGLANVRRIILRHGGETWAESELDKGATFYFSLPAIAVDPSVMNNPTIPATS